MPISEAPVTVEPNVSEPRPSLRSRLLFPVLIFFIITGFYWKLTLTNQYDWVWGPDLAQQVLPWFEEEARQMQHRHIPLWDPHNWVGAPMLGQAQPGLAYPLNWILFLTPRAHGHLQMISFQWYFVVIHYMAALFCYLLCRDLGRSRTASLMAGLVFSLAGYVGTTDWPQMVNGAVWFPLILLFMLRAVRGHKPIVSATLSGVCLGMAWLSGHHQVPLYTTLTVGGIWLYYILREGRIRWSFVRLAAIMVVFMLLVGALQILPANEYGHLAKRWVSAKHEVGWNDPVPYYVHQEFALYPMSLFAIVFPGLNRHADPFIGVVAFAFVLLALALCWKQHEVKLFAAVAIGGLVYSLGHNSVFQGFLYAVVPMLDKARVPSMAVIVFNVGAAVLAAFGVDHFAAQADSVWARRMVIGILGFGLLTYTLIEGTLFMNKLSWGADDRVALTALLAVLLAALLYAWRSGNLNGRQAGVLLTLLLLLELGNNSGFAFMHREDADRRSFIDKVRTNRDIAEYLQQQPGPFRIEMATDALVPNWAEYNNMDVIVALCASVTSNVMDLEWHTWQTRFLYGVRYTLGDKPPFGDSKEVYQGASGIKVFENPGAFPRAWAVHEIIPIKNPRDGMPIINDHLDDLHHKAFSTAKIPALAPCNAADDVSIPSYTPDKITIKAGMGCDGMVVLSDTFYPGWYAKVDGKPAPIYQVNAAMRGLVVPQGVHTVTMVYRPRSVYLGAALTFLGLAGAVVVAMVSRKGGTGLQPVSGQNHKNVG
jgi:Bacterial membrane protein YfhO